jgi:hypothetical protein
MSYKSPVNPVISLNPLFGHQRVTILKGICYLHIQGTRDSKMEAAHYSKIQ